jgi:nickel-dependent lactate racemase
MPGQTYRIPYSKSSIEFTPPPTMEITVAVSRQAEPLKDTQQAIQQALDSPIGSPPLHKLAKTGDRICIVFADITRSSPDHLLVPALLGELEKAGVQDQDITLLCGIGIHRPSTKEEKVAKLGADITARYRIIDNEPLNPAALVDLYRMQCLHFLASSHLFNKDKRYADESPTIGSATFLCDDTDARSRPAIR